MYLPFFFAVWIAIDSSFLTAGSRSSKRLRDDRRIAVEAERQLREVVRADREAVEDVEEFVGEQRVRRHFAHHDDLEAVLALHEAVLLQALR